MLHTEKIIEEMKQINDVARNNIKKHNQEKGVLLTYIQKNSGIGEALFSKWLNGHRELPMKTLMKIETAFPQFFLEQK